MSDVQQDTMTGGEWRLDNAIQKLYSMMRPSSRDITPNKELTRHDYDKLYQDNRVMQNMVNLIPEDSNMKQPNFMFDVPEGQEVDTSEFERIYGQIRCFGEPLEMLDIQGAFTLAMTYARLYGDGFIFIVLEDGIDTSEPVELERIKNVRSLIVKHRYNVTLNYGRQSITAYNDQYNVDPEEAEIPTTGQEFHISRVMRFTGVQIHGSTYVKYGFNKPVLDGIFNSYKNYSNALRSGSDMLASHSIFKYGMNGLNKIVSVGKSQQVKARFFNIMEGMNLFGGLVYDNSSEQADFINRNYGGVKDILMHLQDWMIGNSGMPRSKVFGNAAQAAMSDGSEGDRRLWNEIIARNQNIQLKPNQKMLAYYILASMGITEVMCDIDYEPHYSLSAMEKAELKAKYAEIDVKYINAGILSKEEVRESRFGGSHFSPDISLIEGSLEAEEQEKMEKQQAELEMQSQFQQNNNQPPGN